MAQEGNSVCLASMRPCVQNPEQEQKSLYVLHMEGIKMVDNAQAYISYPDFIEKKC
jgi:hypothetical protein